MNNSLFSARPLIGKIAAVFTVLSLSALMLAPFSVAYAQAAPQDGPTVTDVQPPAADTTPETKTVDANAAVSEETTAETAIDDTTTVDQPQDQGPQQPLMALPAAQQQATGSIVVCKVLLGADGTLATGTAGNTFSIALTDSTGTSIGTASFSTPLSYSADVLGDIDGNDAQCQTLDNLPLSADGDTTIQYQAESVSGPGSWEAPRYDDTLVSSATVNLGAGVLKTFGAQANADGSITIPHAAENSSAPTRMLLVVNQMKSDQQPAPVVNSCVLPNTLGDDSPDIINDSGEKTVQEILNDSGYTSVDANEDQRQYQAWDVSAGQTVTVGATFLDKYADHANVFGYYTNGDTSTFVPLFKKGTVADYPDVPEAANGDHYTFTVPAGAATLGFAIKSYDGSLVGVISTQNSLNDGSVDNVVAYNPSSNTYILGFEDLLSGSDYDFNDVVVVVQIDCTTEHGGGGGGGNDLQCVDGKDNDGDGLIDDKDPGCHTDGDASNPESYDRSDNDETDDGGTGGGSLQCIDGLDNDGDGLVDDKDPGCHTDGNANNASSYDPTDNDETDTTQHSSHHSSHHSSSSSSVPSTPTVLGAQACTEYIHTYIKLGHQNDTDDVSRLQTFLNDYMGDTLSVTGLFDIPTYESLKRFQLKERTEVLVPWVGVTLSNANHGTGWLYKTTKRRINMIKCPELDLPMPQLTIDPQDL